MTRTKFTYTVGAEVEYGSATVLTLIEACTTHYDAKCRGLWDGKYPHNTVFRMARELAWSVIPEGLSAIPDAWDTPGDARAWLAANPCASATTTLSWGELDTVCKSLEMPHTPEGGSICTALRRVFREVRTESERLNPRPPTEETPCSEP